MLEPGRGRWEPIREGGPLPPSFDFVWVYEPHKDSPAFLVVGYRDLFGRWWYGPAQLRIENPTHWQYIEMPAPPAGKENDA